MDDTSNQESLEYYEKGEREGRKHKHRIGLWGHGESIQG